MNLEENRLQTFNDWPSNAAVNPQRLAKAGFFSTNQGLEVECFACHLKISEWNYGDGVMARHIALRPECRFIVNPLTSGNVPIISPTQVPSSSGNLYRESLAMRLASFETWPIANIVTPERLANAGFYYLKEGDNTKCPFCRGVVRAWEPGDDPDLEHKRHFPNCQFVIEVINPRLQGNIGDGANNSNTNSRIGNNLFPNITLVGDLQNLDELGVQAHKGPKTPNYVTIESRLRTFDSWSADLIQTPEVLSQAGFFYEGLGDQVRCFHCDGGLRHWDPHDDPWTEHARWFPNCSFVKLVKGQEFVTACGHNSASQVDREIVRVSDLRKPEGIDDLNWEETVASSNNSKLGVLDNDSEQKSTRALLKSSISQLQPLHSINSKYSAAYMKKPLDDEKLRRIWVESDANLSSDHYEDWLILMKIEYKLKFPKIPLTLLNLKTIQTPTMIHTIPLLVIRDGIMRNKTATVLSHFMEMFGEDPKIMDILRPSTHKPLPRLRREVSQREIQEHLNSPPALAALSIGLNLERVKRAIINKLQDTGSPYSQADALIEAALNLQRDEEDPSDSDSSNINLRQTVCSALLSEAEKVTRGSRPQNVSTPAVDTTSSTDSSDDNSESLPTKKFVSLEDENRITKEARLCKICMNKEMGIVFLPCGHLSTCADCASFLEACPVCRSSIKATVRAFLS